MRSYLLACIAALAFPACTQDIAGGGGGGDDTQTLCGNGTVDPGEACDDGNAASGDGCSATCQTESGVTPRIEATLDKSTVPTALHETVTLTATITSMGGFAGDVTVAATSPDNPLVTVASASPTVTLTDGGTQTVAFTVTIPSDASATAVTNNIKIDLTSSAGTTTLMSAMTIANTFTVIYPDGADTDVAKHQFAGGNFTILRGAHIIFKDEDTTPLAQHITHGGNGLPHETISANTGLLGDVYDVDTIGIAPGTTGQLGCHNHEAAGTYVNFTIM